MCGRVIQKTPLGEIRVLFETMNAVPNSASNYKGAPTQQPPVVRLDEEGRRSLDLLRWGLIPFWVHPWTAPGAQGKNTASSANHGRVQPSIRPGIAAHMV